MTISTTSLIDALAKTPTFSMSADYDEMMAFAVFLSMHLGLPV
jgi:hypothetical protein